MTDTRTAVREVGFEPLECTIPPELTIAEYRNRRVGGAAPARSERRVKQRLRAIIRR